MRQCILFWILMILLCCPVSCGKKSSGPDNKANTANVQDNKPKADPLANLVKLHNSYLNQVRKAPGSFDRHKRNANMILTQARQKDASQYIALYEKELKRLDDAYRAKTLKIMKDARRKSESFAGDDPETAWRERWALWGKSIELLERENRLPGFNCDALISEARQAQRFAELMEEAYRRLSGHKPKAEAALEYQQNPTDALAEMVIFRAWLKARAIISEPQTEDSSGIMDTADAAAQPGTEGAATGDQSKLIAQVDDMIKKYEVLCVEQQKKMAGQEGGGLSALASIPFTDIEASDFLVYFTWTCEGGECETVEDSIFVNTEDSPGMVEGLDDKWREFVLEFEVKFESGSRLWIGTRPSTATGRKEYDKKIPFSSSDDEWHTLRVQVVGVGMSLYELSGDDKTPAMVGDSVVLPTADGQDVVGGFMLGLGANTEIELRHFRLKLLTGKNNEEKKDGDADDGGES